MASDAGDDDDAVRDTSRRHRIRATTSASRWKRQEEDGDVYWFDRLTGAVRSGAERPPEGESFPSLPGSTTSAENSQGGCEPVSATSLSLMAEAEKKYLDASHQRLERAHELALAAPLPNNTSSIGGSSVDRLGTTGQRGDAGDCSSSSSGMAAHSTLHKVVGMKGIARKQRLRLEHTSFTTRDEASARAPAHDQPSTSSFSFLQHDRQRNLRISRGTGLAGQLSFAETRPPRVLLNAGAESLAEARQAKFIRLQAPYGQTEFRSLPSAQQMQRAQLLRQTLEFFKQTWNMSVPSVIFSVTGSALPFTLRPQYDEIFGLSLANATRNTNAWVVTGGTNAGIMKLVGDTLARHEHKGVTLGIASWGTIHGRTTLAEGSKDTDDILVRLPGWTVRVEWGDEGGGAARRHRQQQRWQQGGGGGDGGDSSTDGFPSQEQLLAHFCRFGTVIGASILCQTQPRQRAKTASSDDMVEVNGDSSVPGAPYAHGGLRAAAADGTPNVQLVKTESSVAPRSSSANSALAIPATPAAASSYWALVSFNSDDAVRRCCGDAFQGGSNSSSSKQHRIDGEAIRVRRITVNHHADDDDVATAAERSGFMLHRSSLSESRGSVALPFVYRGKRNEATEGPAGTLLDRCVVPDLVPS